MRGHRLQKQIIFTILLVLALTGMCDVSLSAEETETEAASKVVRVGWFDSSFCYYDPFGRRCGIAYEYQNRISAYTGWTCEYVEDSWPNLLKMLTDGEIDLLSDVSWEKEREEHMFFPDFPMGEESYYIYISAKNREITTDHLDSFNDASIGVNKGSIQEGFLRDWAEKNRLSIEIIPMTEDEDESMEMVLSGELDGYASIYTFNSEQNVVPVCRIGSSEYFYAVNKRRPDLLAELNLALVGIQDEDPLFNRRLTEERLYNTRTNAFLTPLQEDWIAKHETIRVGYRDGYLPFCQRDQETGELTGALKDYLAHATNNLGKGEIRFEPVPYASTKDALEAMQDGGTDCIFPVCLSSYDAEEQGIRLTNPAMTTDVNALMRSSDEQRISRESEITFAVADGDLNIVTFIMDHYPACGKVVFPDDKACFEAVASGKADCVLISNYRMPAVQDLITQYQLFSVPTGESLMLSFAVNKEDRELYFLLNKTVVMAQSEDMASSLASYMLFFQKTSFTQFLKEHWIVVLSILTLLFFLIVALLLQRLRAQRVVNEQQKMMEESLRRELDQKMRLQSAMEMAYRDSLTGVKSKNAWKEAQQRMDERIQEGSVTGFSIVVFDLNDLKQINDSRGHETGDEYIKEASRLICGSFKHSPVFRVGGDEFIALLEGQDYIGQEELLERFEKQVLVNMERGRAVIAFGSSRYIPQLDHSIRDVSERADAAMYKEKTLLKSFGSAKEEDGSRKTEYGFVSEDLNAAGMRRHILIADDIAGNREILGDLLREDYVVLYASDGIETLEILRKRKDEIALLLLDLYMPNMTGQEVMARMQVDEDLMSIPVIVFTVDQQAELDCLKVGAMDFIPKPYPDIEIVKARIAKCIELAENRDLIRRTQRDKLTGLFHFDYFLRYVSRYDQYYKDAAFDAVSCDVNELSSVNEQYGWQFRDLVLRSIGISVNRFARKTGGIGCRGEKDTFLLYCPHQENLEDMLKKLEEGLFVDQETAGKITLRFGIYENAQLEPDVEERFVLAKIASDSVKGDPEKRFGYYQ